MSELKFTDEDLKRLKENIKDQLYANIRDDYGDVNEIDLKALIARLEAAELALKMFRELESEKSNYDDAVSCYNLWRKAAGK